MQNVSILLLRQMEIQLGVITNPVLGVVKLFSYRRLGKNFNTSIVDFLCYVEIFLACLWCVFICCGIRISYIPALLSFICFIEFCNMI